MGNTDNIGPALIRNIHAVVMEHAEELTRLDSAIGDADHGANMARGFTAAVAKLETQPDQSLANALKSTAMTLISTVGGAAGPLYGTAFLRASSALDGKDEIGASDVLGAFEAAIEGVKSRGKASPGEKTMLDALIPALEALRAGVSGGSGISDALQRAAAAAKQGMESTIPMQATKGRASYLGERSVGHQDPGATSSYLIVQSIAETVREFGH